MDAPRQWLADCYICGYEIALALYRVRAIFEASTPHRKRIMNGSISLTKTPMPAFEVDGVAYDLTSMLEANRDDECLCDWLHTAPIGAQFPAFVECRRVA